ncbi:MAG: DUF6507 family protein [Pseudolysinimonas sp.]|uniref:DUF6507 family protein n=1 Tax=Pseudolysinimonas sp. TaxID=2680009 RepID=UPI003265D852
MTGWRVDPAGVTLILTQTEAEVEAVNKALAGPADSITTVQDGAGFDGIVTSAYSAFLQEQYEGTVTQIFGKYKGALEGTANAANAYLAGDEEIATSIAAGLNSVAAVAPPLPGSNG